MKSTAKRCEAHYLSQHDRDRCVLAFGPNNHDMARRRRGALQLPTLIHRLEDGREFTIDGVYVRQKYEEAS